jgi:hypothetical protein
MGHWKKPFKSNYLASCDIEGKDLVLVISHVTQEMCKLASGDEECNLAHFTDKRYKNMILNVGNSKIVRGFANNNSDTDHWNNIPVSIYVDSKVRFGRETVEGLRIRPVQPKITAQGTPTKAKLLPNTQAWTSAVEYLQAGNPIANIEKKYEISPENMILLNQAIEVVEEKVEQSTTEEPKAETNE